MDLLILILMKSLYEDYKEVKQLQKNFNDILRPVEIRGEVNAAISFCSFQDAPFEELLRVLHQDDGKLKTLIPGKSSLERFIEFLISSYASYLHLDSYIYLASLQEMDSNGTVWLVSLTD